MKQLLGIFFLTLATTQAWSAPAAPLRDPTRPPGWQGQGSDLLESSETSLRLEAIRRTPASGGRQVRAQALISGVLVAPGEEIRGLRLIAIGETHVVLEGPEGRQELRLSPAVEQTMRGKGAAGSTSR